MTDDDTVEHWVEAVVGGDHARDAIVALASTGAAGVAAILRARAQPWPSHRDYRDLDADFSEALASIASVDPKPVIDALREEGAPVSALIWALGCCGHPGAIDALVDALAHRDASVRWGAVQGIARTRPPQALDGLLARLRDRSSNVRRAAVKVVADYDDPRVVPALKAYRERYRLLLGEEQAITAALARLAPRD